MRERERERERERLTLFLDLKAKLARARALERSIRRRKNGRASLRRERERMVTRVTVKHTTFLYGNPGNHQVTPDGTTLDIHTFIPSH